MKISDITQREMLAFMKKVEFMNKCSKVINYIYG